MILESITGEYRRYKALADAAMAQLSEDELGRPDAGGGNAVAVIAWHLAGNLTSRFTGFLREDGEKPWRRREDEFAPRTPSRTELREPWERGWNVLFDTLAELTDAQLHDPVTIRGATLPVHAALHRSLAHASYHVGQIVYRARALRGLEWQFLSIPPGGSEAYNRDPTHEQGEAHASRLQDRREPS